MVVVSRMTIALLGTSTTRDHARLHRGAHDPDIGLGLTAHDSPGHVAHIGAVKVEPNAPHQLGHIRLAEARIGTARARGGTVVALVNAAEQDIAIQADGPRMALDDLSDSHIPPILAGFGACSPVT
jgi:hypothetical protein